MVERVVRPRRGGQGKRERGRDREKNARSVYYYSSSYEDFALRLSHRSHCCRRPSQPQALPNRRQETAAAGRTGAQSPKGRFRRSNAPEMSDACDSGSDCSAWGSNCCINDTCREDAVGELGVVGDGAARGGKARLCAAYSPPEMMSCLTRLQTNAARHHGRRPSRSPCILPETLLRS